MTKIYIGNLPWTSNEADVRELFAEYGQVHSVAVVSDRETGRSRGFGFVEMDDTEAQSAIAKLNGRALDGRALNVNEAKAKESRSASAGRRW